MVLSRIQYIMRELSCTVEEAIVYKKFEDGSEKPKPPDPTNKKYGWIVEPQDVHIKMKLAEKFIKAKRSDVIPISKEETKFLDKYPGIIKEL